MILIVPALNTWVLSRLLCESGNVKVLPTALKVAFSPIKTAWVGSCSKVVSESFRRRLIVPLGVIISPSTLTCLPAARLTLPPLSARIVVFSASVNMPPWPSFVLLAVKLSDTGLRVVSGNTPVVATLATVAVPAWFAKPASNFQVFDCA